MTSQNSGKINNKVTTTRGETTRVSHCLGDNLGKKDFKKNDWMIIFSNILISKNYKAYCKII